MTNFDFSEFEEISREISEKPKKSRVTAKSQAAMDLAFSKLEPDTQTILVNTGLIYKECCSRVTHPDKKGRESLDFFKQSRPKIRSADGFVADKIRANYYFRCSVVALAAQNKGKIAIVDLACLWQYFQLGYFVDVHNKSTAKIAGKLQYDLIREVTVKGEYLEIPGIGIDSDGAKYCKLGNNAITAVKSQLLKGPIKSKV